MALTEVDQSGLIEAAAGGDIESFGELARRYYACLAAIGYSVLGDHGLAEDAAQETLARALVNIRKLKDRSKFGPWLASICRNTAKDMLARRSRGIDCENFAKASEDYDGHEGIAAVRRAMERLGGSVKEIIVLRYYDGLSYDEISSVLGISKASVNGRLTRAKRKMAELLRHDGVPGD